MSPTGKDPWSRADTFWPVAIGLAALAGGDPSAAILESNVDFLPHPDAEVLSILSPRLQLAEAILSSAGRRK